MTDDELRKEITEILDTMAEIYCQIGETRPDRSRPMQSGMAYIDAILALITQAVREARIEELEKAIDGHMNGFHHGDWEQDIKYRIAALQAEEEKDD